MKRFLVLLVMTILIVFTACGGGGGGGSDDSNNNSDDEGTVEQITLAQAQDILYTAYAGIGYMKPDDATDNERMYNAMFYDLNQLTGLMIGKAVYFDTNALTKIALLVSAGGTQTFVNDADVEYNDNDKVAITLKVVSGGLTREEITVFETDADGQIVFNEDGTPKTITQTVNKVNLVCDLTVDFKGTDAYVPTDFTGAAIGTTTYTGDQAVDLTTHADIDIVWSSAVDVIGHEFSITTSKTLKATSQDSPTYTIQYQPWNITYAFNEDDTLINMHILPVDYLMEAFGFSYDMSDLADYQLYTLSGSFTLNDTAYTFNNMKYGQLEIDQDCPFDGRYIALDGEINGVDVYSLGAEILQGDLTALAGKIITGSASLTDVITRDDDGLWTGGQLTLKAVDNEAEVDFSVNTSNQGVAAFVITEGVSGGSVIDWQNFLDPLD